MIARLQARLNELERRSPLRYAAVVILGCDGVLGVALALARPFA